MMININCKSNDGGVWCKDRRTKRSLFGLGKRMCLLASHQSYATKTCPFRETYPRPPAPKGCGGKP